MTHSAASIMIAAVSVLMGNARQIGSGPELALELNQQDPLVTGPLDIYVTITNVTNDNLLIHSARVLFPSAVESTRDNPPRDLSTCGTATVDTSSIPLPAHSQRFYHCVFPRYDRSAIAQFLDSSTFFFLPGIYRVQAVLEYSIQSDSALQSAPPARRFLRHTAELELKPPLYALLRGAWIGCLLIALFLVVRAMRSDRQSPGRMLRHGGRVLLTGLVTSTIAILLLQRLSDIGLPITLEVNDWIGGLIVGLIAYGSTDLLYKRLAGGGSDENPTDARGTAEY